MPESWSQVADKSRNLVVVPCRFPGLLTTLAFFLRCGGCFCVSWSSARHDRMFSIPTSQVTFCFENSTLQRTLLHLIRSVSHHKQGIGYGWESHARSFLGPFRYCDGWRAWLADTVNTPQHLLEPPLLHAVGDDNLSFSKGPSFQLQLVSPFQRHDSK